MMKEEISRKVSIVRTALSFTVMVGPRRSWWTIIVVPLAFFYTEFRLMAAAEHLPFVRTLFALGVGLGLFYGWWFCWNVFGRQELVFSEGEMTITGRLLGMSRSRKVRMGDITGVRLKGVGYRAPSCVMFDVASRKAPYAFGENMSDSDLLAILRAIRSGIPMLAGKVHLRD
jgi:hypothetical protein